MGADRVAGADAAPAGDPSRAHAHFRLGIRRLRERRHQEAVSALERAIAIAPGLARAHHALGQALEGLYRLREAADAYSRALSCRDDYAQAANDLGNVLESLREPQRALEAYRRAAVLSPGSAEVQANIGHALQTLGALEEALTAYRAAVTRNPALVPARYLLGAALLRTGDPEGALREARCCLSGSPHHQESIALEGLALRALGRERESRALLDLERFVHAMPLPTPAGFASVTAFNRALRRQILEEAPLLRDPPGASTRHGRHSGDILAGAGGPAGALKSALEDVFGAYLRALPVDRSHPFLSREPRRVRLVAQANILEGGGYLVPHDHPHAWVSGAYYVDLPSVSDAHAAGWLEIGRPPDGLAPGVEYEVRRVRPEEGLVVLFPSYFYHGTIPFEAPAERFSLGVDVLADTP